MIGIVVAVDVTAGFDGGGGVCAIVEVLEGILELVVGVFGSIGGCC